ncbi:MAG: cytochrome d ubiquinol oxidase subunit II [Acidimicrobiales bacterium]
MSDVVAVFLFAGVIPYAVLGGADFGAGFWDLTSRGSADGVAARDLIDHSIGPVWEANHVWLIYCLVVLWTAFPSAFAAITTTLFVPLGLAALGIVLRGSGFAFRKALDPTRLRRVAGVVFAVSSIVTPFFLGAAVGGIASGRVPTGGAWNSWVNPASMLGGMLAVATCSYLAAVFLCAEARVRGAQHLERWFRARAITSAAAAGVLALGGIAVLSSDAPRLFDQLLRPGLPFVAASGAAGVTALLLLSRATPWVVRLLAVVAVASIVAGWGVAQYPYLLGTHLTLSDGAAPRSTLWALVAIGTAAATLCGPSLAYLYLLQQRGRLEEI